MLGMHIVLPCAFCIGARLLHVGRCTMLGMCAVMLRGHWPVVCLVAHMSMAINLVGLFGRAMTRAMANLWLIQWCAMACLWPGFGMPIGLGY